MTPAIDSHYDLSQRLGWIIGRGHSYTVAEGGVSRL